MCMHWYTWNCRGLRLSVPYIQSLLNEDIKILILTENWLWLYQLHDLNNIHPCFLASGCYVKRLHEQAKWTRGCGSVGIFWHRSLCVSWLEISSDSFSAIKEPLSNQEDTSHYWSLHASYWLSPWGLHWSHSRFNHYTFSIKWCHNLQVTSVHLIVKIQMLKEKKSSEWLIDVCFTMLHNVACQRAQVYFLLRWN